MDKKKRSFVINHLGEERALYFNAVSPPLIQSSNFAFPSVAEFREAVGQQHIQHMYTRGNNPTVNILRQKLAALEGTEDALLFSSGVAAISAAVIANLQAGDHAICVEKPYGWTNELFNNWLPCYGVSTTFIDGNDVANFKEAIQPNTKLIMLESPNSFTFEVQDLKAFAQIAQENGILTVLDNTQACSLGQRATELGIDLVTHTASKYYGGHSDVVAGVVCGSSTMIKHIFENHYMVFGGILSPNDAWLILRSLRTLELRLDKINQNAQAVCSFLKKHPKVNKVYYPFDEDFPQYKLARQQMTMGGGLVSFELNVKETALVERFVDSLQYFLLAVSWGGHESLVMPACALVDDIEKLHPKMPWNLVRLYTGLENAEVLINDLEQALAKV